MSINLSSRYQEIHDRVWDQYMTPPENERDEHWWRKYAPKWRNRVGLDGLLHAWAACAGQSLSGAWSSSSASTHRSGHGRTRGDMLPASP